MNVYDAEGLCAPHVTECHNLRPAPQGAGLVPVGVPEVVAPAGDVPFYEFSAADGVHFITRGRGALWLDGYTELCGLDPEPYTALYDGDATLYVMTAAGARAFAWPGLEPQADAEGDFPPCVLSAVPGPVSPVVTVPPLQLDDNYRRKAALSASDARTLAADLQNGLRTLAGEARAHNAMTQPALARYRLLDAEGRVLFTSPVVLLGESHNYQGVRLAVDSAGVAAGYTLQAPSWCLQVQVPRGMPARVRTVQVSLSPQLHPAAWWEEPQVTLTHGGTTSASTVSVLPAAASTAVVPGRYGDAAATLGALAARMDAVEQVVAMVAPVAGTVELAWPGVGVPRDEWAELDAALGRDVVAAGTAVARLQAPHGFSARCAARSGDTVLWADLSPLRYAGYPLPLLAAATAPGEAWTAFVAVDFADGGRSVWTGGGDSGAPLSLGPLLSYPSPDAVSMTIGLTRGGSSFCGTFPLTALPDGRAAAYVHPSVAPFELAPGSCEAPAPVEKACRYSSTVMAADAATPLVALALRDCCGGRVERLLPAAGSTGAWDFGRTRFLAFGHGGIMSVALGSARDSLATGHIDSRRVEHPAAVAPVAAGEVYAVAGGDLVRLTGTKLATVVRSCGYSQIAWIAPHAELLAMAGDDYPAIVLTTATRRLRTYTRSLAPVALLGGIHGAYAATASGVVALHRESAAPAAVKWQMRARGPFSRCAGGLPLRRLRLNACGSGLRLRLAVAATSWLAPEPVPTASVELRGRLSTPHELRVAMRPAAAAEITVEGTAGPDFILESIEL